MGKPNLPQIPFLQPISMQPYERYLPTAFDDSLTLLEKVNKLIYAYQQISETTNQIIQQWEDLVKWVVGQGLQDELNKIIHDMLEKGEFGEVFLSLPKNVRYYGAYGDGISDDTNAIQTALNGGGRIYVPEGNYRLTKRLIIEKNTYFTLHPNAKISFDANDYCILQNGSNDNCDCLTGYNGNGNIIIEGGIWDCGGSASSDIRGGIFLGHGSNIIIRNATIRNVKELHFIEINSSEHVTVEKCIFENFIGDRTYAEAVQIDLASSAENFPPFGQYDNTLCRHIVIKDCVFRNVGAGIGTHVTQPQMWHEHIIIKDNFFDGLMTHAVHFQNFKEFVVSGNKASNGKTGALLEGCYEGVIENNIFADMSGNGVQLSNCTFVKVLNNSIKRCLNGFTGYDNTSDVIVENNRIESCTQNGVNYTGGANNIVNKNSVAKNGAYGVYLHDGLSDSIIRDNKIIDNALSGIAITNATNNKVIDNYIVGNSTNGTLGNVNLLSGASKNEIRNNYIRKGSGQANYGIAVDANAANDNKIINNDVDTTAYAQKAYVDQKEWIPLTLSNGWSNYDPNNPVSYSVRGDRVIFKGIANVGTLGGNDNDDTMAFKLPGLATPKQANFKTIGGIGGDTTSFVRVNVFTSGRVTIPVVNSITAVDFSGLEVNLA